MILLDYSQIAISNILMSMEARKSMDEGLVRHMILNTIRKYRLDFNKKYGEIVICCDGGNVWRKDIFPPYKFKRKSDRATSVHNWSNIFNALEMVKAELREHMPYAVVQLDGAEADDVIASLCMKYGNYEHHDDDTKCLIVSSDKDFMQLQKFANVYQYSPIQKKHLTINNPDRFLKEHILFGDRGDGIPNFLSPDDTFINNKRQKSIPKKFIDEWVQEPPNTIEYNRNKVLIDFTYIPNQLRESIFAEYINSKQGRDRSKMLSYFMKHRLSALIPKLGEF